MNHNDRFDKVEEKIDRVDSRLDNVEKILAVNTAVLEEHQRRSTTLEDRFINELKPLKNHVALMTYGFKVVVWISMAVAGIVGFLKLLKDLNLF